jgi:hypothetical protein
MVRWADKPKEHRLSFGEANLSFMPMRALQERGHIFDKKIYTYQQQQLRM